MNIGYFLFSIFCFGFGLYLFLYTRRNKPATDGNGFNGPLPEHYMKAKILAFPLMLIGLILIITSLTN